MTIIRLIIFDCDLTLWNHSDASELKHPLVLVDRDTLRDQDGTVIPLFPQVRAVLDELERRGYLLSVASWNRREAVMTMLDLYGLQDYVRHAKAESHPDKAEMIRRTIQEFVADGEALTPQQVLFIDDRTLHTAEIQAQLPGLHVLQMWVDLRDHKALLGWLESQ